MGSKVIRGHPFGLMFHFLVLPGDTRTFSEEATVRGVGPRALRASDLPSNPRHTQTAALFLVATRRAFEEEMDSGTFLTLRGAADLTLAGAAATLT